MATSGPGETQNNQLIKINMYKNVDGFLIHAKFKIHS